jgi:excisionase family DNA binding protein
MTTAANPDVLTAAGVAALFGVASKTVTRWARSGKLPESFRTPGGHRRWRREVVEAALRGESS